MAFLTDGLGVGNAYAGLSVGPKNTAFGTGLRAEIESPFESTLGLFVSDRSLVNRASEKSKHI